MKNNFSVQKGKKIDSFDIEILDNFFFSNLSRLTQMQKIYLNANIHRMTLKLELLFRL